MKKKSYTFSLSQGLIQHIDEIWRIEQAAALEKGEAISKSSIVEKLIIMGIKEYKRQKKTSNF